MEIKVFKSTELSDTDWEQITSGFNTSFERDKKQGEFKKYYQSNVFGYSYHAVGRNEEGEICAHSSVIPVYYTVQGHQYKFGQGGTSFVLKDYRKDIFLFAELYNALKVYCAIDDVKVIAGVSNKKSFKYAILIAKSTFIKDLDYYILPVSISKFLKKKQLRFLDVLWKGPLLFLMVMNRLVCFFANSEEKEWPIKLLLNDNFLKNRIDDRYKKYVGRKSFGLYRMYDEDGIQTAYIMDFRQHGKRTLRALISLVAYIFRQEKVDAILFIGDLQIKQFLLFKVPSKKIPQRFPLTIDYLGEGNEEVKKVVLSPKSWDFSLINFDVR